MTEGWAYDKHRSYQADWYHSPVAVLEDEFAEIGPQSAKTQNGKVETGWTEEKEIDFPP